MSGLHSALGDRVGNQEEIKLSVDDFALLDKSLINVGSLRRVQYSVAFLLEESLSDPLVDDNQGDLGSLVLVLAVVSVLLVDDHFDLRQFVVENLLSHGISHTISVDEDVLRQGSFVVFAVGLEAVEKVFAKDVLGDDFFTLLLLGACLGIVLAHVLVVGSNEPNDTLTALVAHIDTNQHGRFRDFLRELHSPEISSKFGVDLSEEVHVDSEVVLVDGSVLNKLRNHRAIAVDLVLQSSVEVLLLITIRNDDQEEVEFVDSGLALLELLSY